MKTIDEILEQCNPREEDGHAYYWHGDAVKAAELYAQQFKDEATKLQAFKDYVHKRLDDAGVPIDPESPHKEKGCRIGGRLDVVLEEKAKLIEFIKVQSGGISNISMSSRAILDEVYRMLTSPQ